MKSYLFYGVETHAEINRLSQGRGYLKGKYLSFHFILVGAVPIKNCDTKMASLRKGYSQGLFIKDFS